MLVLWRGYICKRKQEDVFCMREWIVQPRINGYMHTLSCRKSFVGRLHELPGLQSWEVLVREELPYVRRRDVCRVRLSVLRCMCERLRTSRVELLHLMRSWEKYER